MDIKKKIVVIGGGNGSAITIRALKKYKDEFDISAVIGTSDSGGSSGKLREELNTLPFDGFKKNSKLKYQTKPNDSFFASDQK